MPAIPVVEPEQPPGNWRQLPEGLSRRTLGIILAVAVELLILLVLLSLGVRTGPPPPEAGNITTFEAGEAEEPDTAETTEPESTAEEASPTQPRPPSPLVPIPLPPTALPREGEVVVPPPQPTATPQPEPQPTPEPSGPPRARAVVRPGANVGPADTGRRGGGEDSQVVGTAPDGSPLYAARWYQEPTDQQLAGFLSGARGPGWGLIACRTAPNWRVQDCVVLSESPAGSNIGNAVNAAAWQFLVRPPRVGGEYLVGSWVRIRITLEPGRPPRG